MIKLTLFFLFVPLITLAQGTYPRDTSYTVRSAYEKLSKSYPFIEIAKPKMPEGVEDRQNIVYRTLENRRLHLDCYYPLRKPGKVYPAVLLIHGGGWRSGDKSLMGPMARQLAAHGYVAVTAAYRLSLEAPYPAAVHDLKAAIRWIRAKAAKFAVDTSRIAVLGCSAGGQLAALIGTTNGLKAWEGQGDFPGYSSAVQAIIDIDGVLAFKHPVSKEGKMAGQWLGGSYTEVPENWQEASALTHVDSTTPPVLFIGSSIPRFLAGRKDMTNRLDANNIYSETHIIPDSPHSFWLFHPWFAPTLQYIAGFLDKVFKKP